MTPDQVERFEQYTIGSNSWVEPSPDGDWVRFSDYEKLRSGNEQVKAGLIRADEEVMRLRKENERLRGLIERSDLVEVDGSTATSDGCCGIVLKPCGKILVHKDHRAGVEQRTKDLQKMAGMARRIAKLEQMLNRIVRNVREEHNSRATAVIQAVPKDDIDAARALLED